MKKIITLFICTLLMSNAFAQNEQYVSAMKDHLTKMGNANNAESYLTVANGFERIAAAEKSEWLPRYYAAFCYVMQAFSTEDKDKIDAIADQADKMLDEAASISDKNDEILCLQSLTKSARIGVNPMTRGMKYGPQASELLAKAKEINANNPRIYYLEGQSKFYTPAAFGGGKDKAKVLLEKAVSLYATFKPANELMPTWGAEQAKEMLEKCK